LKWKCPNDDEGPAISIGNAPAHVGLAGPYGVLYTARADAAAMFPVNSGSPNRAIN
jgi:hypothetical protein